MELSSEVAKNASPSLCQKSLQFAAGYLTTCLLMGISKQGAQKLSSSGEQLYHSHCDSPLNSIPCANFYTNMKIFHLLDGIDKLGGIFVVTSALFLTSTLASLAFRSVKNYMHPKID